MTSTPFVTVLMPIRNEGAFIERSLGSVLAQDYPADRMEVLVADGMSTDCTRDVVERVARADRRVRLIDNPEGIVATGLNRAMRVARGDVIVRVDGHCEIAPEYVRRCVTYLADGRVQGVGGPLDTIGQTPVAAAIAAAMSSRFGVGGSAFRTVRGRSILTDTVAFPGYSRAVMERAGPFDEELVRNQDDEYNYRLRKLGAKILLASDVRARYYSRSSFRSLWRQYLQYGYWKVRVMQKHPRQMQPRHFVPATFVLGALGGVIAAAVSTIGLVAVGALLGAYAVAILVAVVAVCRAQRVAAWWWLPPAFATLHVSYGVGMLIGLYKFRRRWGCDGAPDRPTSRLTPGSPVINA
jgi:glycosyltransferase involved in cell wall biosynthesis